MHTILGTGEDASTIAAPTDDILRPPPLPPPGLRENETRQKWKGETHLGLRELLLHRRIGYNNTGYVLENEVSGASVT